MTEPPLAPPALVEPPAPNDPPEGEPPAPLAPPSPPPIPEEPQADAASRAADQTSNGVTSLGTLRPKNDSIKAHHCACPSGIGERKRSAGRSDDGCIGCPCRRRRKIGRPFHLELIIRRRSPLKLKTIGRHQRAGNRKRQAARSRRRRGQPVEFQRTQSTRQRAVVEERNGAIGRRHRYRSDAIGCRRKPVR